MSVDRLYNGARKRGSDRVTDVVVSQLGSGVVRSGVVAWWRGGGGVAYGSARTGTAGANVVSVRVGVARVALTLDFCVVGLERVTVGTRARRALGVS